MWSGKAFGLGLALGGLIVFGVELAPMLRDPSLRFAVERPTTRSPAEGADELVAVVALFVGMGITVELLDQGRRYLEATP